MENLCLEYCHIPEIESIRFAFFDAFWIRELFESNLGKLECKFNESLNSKSKNFLILNKITFECLNWICQNCRSKWIFFCLNLKTFDVPIPFFCQPLLSFCFFPRKKWTLSIIEKFIFSITNLAASSRFIKDLRGFWNGNSINLHLLVLKVINFITSYLRHFDDKKFRPVTRFNPKMKNANFDSKHS